MKLQTLSVVMLGTTIACGGAAPGDSGAGAGQGDPNASTLVGSAEGTGQVSSAQTAAPTCDVLHVGDLWVDPATGSVFKCTCVAIQDNAELVCSWAPLLDRRRLTWRNLNSGMDVEVFHSSLSDGATVDQWTSNGTDTQVWDMHANPDGSYQILNDNSGRCLAILNANTGRGAAVIQWACNGHPDQAWLPAWTGTYVAGDQPVVNFINKNSGLALDVPHLSTARGTALWQWPFNGTRAQAFY